MEGRLGLRMGLGPEQTPSTLGEDLQKEAVLRFFC